MKNSSKITLTPKRQRDIGERKEEEKIKRKMLMFISSYNNLYTLGKCIKIMEISL